MTDNRLLTEQEQKVLASLKDVKPLLGEPTGLPDGEVEILGVRGRLLTTDMAIDESYKHGYQEGYAACNKEWQDKIKEIRDRIHLSDSLSGDANLVALGGLQVCNELLEAMK